MGEGWVMEGGREVMGEGGGGREVMREGGDGGGR